MVYSNLKGESYAVYPADVGFAVNLGSACRFEFPIRSHTKQRKFKAARSDQKVLLQIFRLYIPDLFNFLRYLSINSMNKQNWSFKRYDVSTNTSLPVATKGPQFRDAIVTPLRAIFDNFGKVNKNRQLIAMITLLLSGL